MILIDRSTASIKANPLNKNQGFRPIGVGEILRRIAGKVVTTALPEEIISSVGCLHAFVCNCHVGNLRLFVIGGVEISSKEGTTQGDPVAMAIYAIAILPLIIMLIETSVSKNHVRFQLALQMI